MPIRTLAERFEDKVFRGGYTSCWLWTGAVNSAGYGNIRDDENRTVKAHRASWTLNVGEIPPDKIVCHHCDNPLCVNPEHLFLGTFQDNTSDCISKGRFRAGAWRRASSHCPSGHAYDEKNTYWTKRGTRVCRACSRINHQKRGAV